MKKGGGSSDGKEIKGRKMGGQDFIKNRKKMKKNMQRLGGKGGLSLESFANAKTRNDNYNPSLISTSLPFSSFSCHDFSYLSFSRIFA